MYKAVKSFFTVLVEVILGVAVGIPPTSESARNIKVKSAAGVAVIACIILIVVATIASLVW